MCVFGVCVFSFLSCPFPNTPNYFCVQLPFTTTTTTKGTLLHKVQRVYQSIFGFTVPLFWGRRLWGVPTVLPMRKPVHVVVGKPMPVDAFDGDVMSDEGKKAVEGSGYEGMSKKVTIT